MNFLCCLSLEVFTIGVSGAVEILHLYFLKPFANFFSDSCNLGLDHRVRGAVMYSKATSFFWRSGGVHLLFVIQYCEVFAYGFSFISECANIIAITKIRVFYHCIIFHQVASKNFISRVTISFLAFST
jgi:hypothetical protein